MQINYNIRDLADYIILSLLPMAFIYRYFIIMLKLVIEVKLTDIDINWPPNNLIILISSYTTGKTCINNKKNPT